MPVVETTIQHFEIMPFLCRREEEGGLGYRETAANIVSHDLFIPSHLQEFVSTNSPDSWRKLVRKHRNDETEALKVIKEEIKKRLTPSANVAIFLSKNRSITVEGETFTLFYVSGTETAGDTEFKKNIFAAVEEMKHSVTCNDHIIQNLRPDISFFVNGIFLGYLELKSVTNGQNAADHGRGKVIADYLESVKGIADLEQTHADAINDRRKTLWMFEKGIHIVTTDVNETYVIRNIAQFFDDAHKGFYERTASVSALRPDIEKVFKPYPISSMTLSEKQRFEEIMNALYSKKMVEKEILYYNFLQYKYIEKKGRGGKKERTDNTGFLISPRPKQKFGCDKIMSRVREMLIHEREPNYYSDKLRRQLRALQVTEEKIEDIIQQRDRYCNNKYVYSLLMQYAAGFGKSNIIGWTALQLKDMRHEGKWAYDKIMIVVDRLQLRDQIDTMMMSMNIDKSMFVEVTNQDTFVRALTDTKRIIVVNIQKFLELQNALNRAGKTLGKMRVAFLIDEIHRSNTGENNKEMVNLFEKLQDSINETAQADGTEVKKKNLIVGFTATPTEKVLARFGEFKSASIIPTWVPFDSYTMKEAIEDGYILDPTKHIIPVVSKITFELPEGVDPNDEGDMTIQKEKIYSNPERMEQISQFIVNRLSSLVYGKIHGTGKAMLAVTSIPNAISYCNIIRRLMAEKCQEPMYRRYKDAPISIVYSDNQQYESSASMNDGKAEEKVIQDFKQGKNGLMIVVDKLQTGFDEPKLHTLFLDKEIRDVNAIQTISRVNRTCKYKEECHVVDLSWQNVNVQNIRDAFHKYCGITTSDFNPDHEALVVKMLYDQLCKSEPYAQWFKRFKTLNNDPSFIIQMEDGIRQWIRLQFERTQANDALSATDDAYMQVINEAKELRSTVGKYGSALMALEDVLDIDDIYKAPLFLKFWEIYCRIYRDLMRGSGGEGTLHPDVEGDDEIPGITVAEAEEDGGDDEGGENGGGRGPSNGGSEGGSAQKLIDIINRFNETEEISAAVAEMWQREIFSMFETFACDERLIAVLTDNTFMPEEKMSEYTKALRKYKRSLSHREDFMKVESFKKLLDQNMEQLLDIFIQLLPQIQAEMIDFGHAEEGNAANE